jgi:phosphoglucan,water dikinase
LRKIYPWLPSSASSFRTAEPLTRIRDIAHRNDIPPELKREIKERLQNKLHRCAGPEDLVTSKELLERITAPGAAYSVEFVEQFRIFHEELKEFFNARTLEERLKALLAWANPQQAELIQAFLDRQSSAGLGEKQGDLAALTSLRASLVEQIRKQPGPETVEFLLADLGLEDFAFVLLSEITNRIEARPGPERWKPLLQAWRLAVNNLDLSQLAPEECGAIWSELRAWGEGFDASDRDQLLRLKATADRTRRLAEGYSDQILELFVPRVEKLGRALGVDEKARRVFAEADIRAHLVFQVSKLISLVLAQIRAQLGLPPWEVLVSGRASGVLKAVDRLETFHSGEREQHLVLLEHATGEEEIPRGIEALILGHSIPHLSHLGVRARQAGVVLVASEDRDAFEKLRKLEGQQIELRASAEAFEWQTGAVSGDKRKEAAPRPIRIPEARLESKCRMLPLEEATLENAGGKANGTRRLAELARRKGAGFETAPTAVIPFGAMEAALRAEPGVEKEYGRLLHETQEAPAERISAAAEKLERLIEGLKVPQEIETEVEGQFGTGTKLMARSSANCEDLEEMAGAGLYESVANVKAPDLAKAVSKVWASLWTPRATLSRAQAGIPHEQAHMAVLIQQMLAPDYSFVLHTANPSNQSTREVYIELAVGLGETLVSAAVPGSPYRLVCDKETGATTTLAFASFSRARRCQPDGGVAEETVDYSREPLSRDSEARSQLGRRLAAIGRLVEEAFGRPQDIEGAVIGEKIYLLQARAQQGLSH